MNMNKTKVISKNVEETLQEIYSKENLSTEEYGGPYFRPKLKQGGRELDNFLIRDCKGVGNGCDYEIIYSTFDLDENEVFVVPIQGDWKSKVYDLVVSMIDHIDPKFKTKSFKY